MYSVTSRNIDSWLLAGLLLMTGLVRFPTHDYVGLINELFVISAAAALALVLIRGRVGTIDAPWVGIFLLIMVVSSYLDYTQEAHMATRAIFCGVVLYGALMMLRPDPGPILWTMGVLLIVHTVVQVIQVSQVWPFNGWTSVIMRQDTGVGVTESIGTASQLTAFCGVAFFPSKRKWWVLPVVLSFAMSRATGGVFALTCGGLYYFGMKHWRMSAALVVAAICYAVFFDSPGTSWRIDIWKATITEIAQSPFVGYGAGNFKVYGPQINGMTSWYTFNEILQVAYDSGIFAAAALMTAVSVVFYRATRLFRAAIITVVAGCSIYFPMHIGVTALPAIYWFGMAHNSQE